MYNDCRISNWSSAAAGLEITVSAISCSEIVILNLAEDSIVRISQLKQKNSKWQVL
jgi:hypothetical protein